MSTVRFLRAIPRAVEPRRADPSALGTLPTRAYRHCAAVTAASGHGWYVYPPTGLGFQRAGDEVRWTCDELGGEWLDLSDAAQFPDFAAEWDRAAPEGARGFSPPFVSSLREPGSVQVWTGLMVRTAPGWNTLIRPPANLPHPPRGALFYEGSVETDSWFGPLFTNFRLTTDDAVLMPRHWPIAQVQAVQRSTYHDPALQRADWTPGLGEWSPEDWGDYRRTVVGPNLDEGRQTGNYAARSRRAARRQEGA